MSSQSSTKMNLIQNREDFELDPIEKQLPLFKFLLFSKELDYVTDSEDPSLAIRTCTVKCLFKGCL